MPREVECRSCGLTLLGFESLAPEPIGRETCPECGGTEFEFVSADDGDGDG